MMMMTVCWMERMTALESPDVAGGRYVTRGGGEDLFAGAAADLPFTPRTSGHIAKIVCSHSPTVQHMSPFALPFPTGEEECCNWGDVEAIEDVMEESAVSDVVFAEEE